MHLDALIFILEKLYQKPLRFWQKTQGFEKKLKVMRPYWAYWASKKCTKTSLGQVLVHRAQGTGRLPAWPVDAATASITGSISSH